MNRHALTHPLALLLCAATVALCPAAQPPRLGCQARTFGEGIYKDEAAFLDVLRQIGQVGFAGIETNWKNLERYYERPAEFAKILKDARLTLVGAHMGGSPWAATPMPKLLDDVGRTARFVKAMGGEAIVFSGSLPKARPLPPDTWQTMAKFLDAIGRACAAHGVRCLYHNHWVECEFDGLQTLCDLTDANLVGFAFDTGHAVRAGKDPAVIIAKLGPRLGLIHFADASDALDSPTKRPPLGQGTMNIPAVVQALQKCGFHGWIVLEEESSGTGRTLAENGFRLLQKLFAP